MEEKSRSVISNGIYFGLITGGVLIFFSLIMYLLDLYMNQAVNWIGLFAGILASIYLFVFVQFIHPGFINELLDQMRTNMLTSNPNMSEDQIEQAVAVSSKFMSPLMMTLWGLAAYAAMSAIFGLIIAIFLKKEDPSLNTTV